MAALESRLVDLANAVGADVRRAVMRGNAVVGFPGASVRRGLMPVCTGMALAGSIQIPVNGVTYWPVLVPAGVDIVKLSCFNGSAAGAGGTGIRLGLYDSLSTGAPGERLAASGPLASVAFTEFSYTLGSALRLPAGMYWLAFAHNYATTAPSIYANTAGSNALNPLAMAQTIGPTLYLRQALTAGWTELPANAAATSAMTAQQGTVLSLLAEVA